jgi:hypothetical protein
VSDIDTGVVDSLKALDPDGRLEKRKSIGALATSQKCQNLTLHRSKCVAISTTLARADRNRGIVDTDDKNLTTPLK